MNKNLIIGILAALLVLASLWGQVGTQSKKAVVQDKKEAVAALSQIKAEADKGQSGLLAENVQLKKEHQEMTAQYDKARHELIDLRKANKVFEAKASNASKASKDDSVIKAMKADRKKLANTAREIKRNLTADVAKKTKEIDTLKKQLTAMQSKVKKCGQQLAAATQAQAKNNATGKAETGERQEKLQQAETIIKNQQAKLQEAVAIIEDQQGKLQRVEEKFLEMQEKVTAAEAAVQAANQAADEQAKTAAQTAEGQAKAASEFESLRAQVIGLAKIVEEKNAALAKTNKELSNWKVNMNVLLGRIADQQDSLQKQQQENRDLVKEIAAKNKELVRVNEQLIQTPVQQQ